MVDDLPNMAGADGRAEVTDTDVNAVYSAYVQRALRPWHTGGISPLLIEAAARLQPIEWNMRYQIVNGHVYTLGTNRPPVNHHHRKRMLGVKQILLALVRAGPRVADVDFVVNFGDSPKVLAPPLYHVV